MTDVAEVLRRYVGEESLRAFFDDLAATGTAQRQLLFREYLRRMRKAAGIALAPEMERGGLLEGLDDGRF